MLRLFNRKKYRLVIGAIFRNEVEYILEWIAWHQSQGVEKFIIFDNYSDDGTFELLEKLKKKDIIDLYRIERGDKVQLEAYKKILMLCDSGIDYIGFIDADEFIMPQDNKKLIDHLDIAFKDDNVGALAINWRIYGTSGNTYQTDDFVINRFVKCATDDHLRNHYIKSIYRPNAVDKIFPHRATLKKGFKYITTTGEFASFATSNCSLVKVDGMQTTGMTFNVCSKLLRVNHYAIKSDEEFLNKKKYRGDVMSGAEHIKSDGYFREFNCNDIEVPIDKDHYNNFLNSYRLLFDEII